MILPGRHLPLSRSLLNVGAILLGSINGRRTVSLLWDAVKDRPEVGSFGRFALGLDLLFILGLIDMGEDGTIVQRRGDGR